MKLVLDHFYYVVSRKDFAEVLKLKNLFPSAEHRKTSSTKESWEGLYFYGGDGVYFELLKESPWLKKGAIGAGFSRHGRERRVHSFLTKAYPGLKWRFEEQKRSDGSPWFHYSELLFRGNGPKLWVMDYQGAEAIKRRSFKDRAREISSFVSFRGGVNSEIFKKLKKMFVWIAGQGIDQNNNQTYEMPPIDSRKFNFSFDLTSGKNPAFELTLNLNKGVALPRLQSKFIAVNRQRERLVVRFGSDRQVAL